MRLTSRQVQAMEGHPLSQGQIAGFLVARRLGRWSVPACRGWSLLGSLRLLRRRGFRRGHSPNRLFLAIEELIRGRTSTGLCGRIDKKTTPSYLSARVWAPMSPCIVALQLSPCRSPNSAAFSAGWTLRRSRGTWSMIAKGGRRFSQPIVHKPNSMAQPKDGRMMMR